MTVTQRMVSANGIRFHLAEDGTGPLVLLLPGFGQTWQNWRHQLDTLARAGYHVVAVDPRGAGESDKPPRGYDAFTLSDDVAGLVRALGERDATLVGHGFGGVLAFNTAVLHPDRVRGLVAIAAPYPAHMAGLRRLVAWNNYGRLLLFAAFPFFPHRRLRAAGGAMLERIVRRQAGPAWQATTDFADTVAVMQQAIVIPGAAKGAIEQLRWVARSPWRSDGHRHREALSHPIAAPVLHLVGEADGFTPVAAIADAAEHCAGDYQRRVLPGVGHYPAEEAPDEVNALIIDFLGESAHATQQPDPAVAADEQTV